MAFVLAPVKGRCPRGVRAASQRRVTRCCVPADSDVPEKISGAKAVEGTPLPASAEVDEKDAEPEEVEEPEEVVEPGSALVSGSPFTKRIMKSPMSKEDRQYYINAATDSTMRALEDFKAGKGESNAIKVTMLLPELNTSLDIYDRRLLLSLVWEIVVELVQERNLKTLVMTQAPGQFGAQPLSVAGLRKHFQGDWERSKETWGTEGRLRTGDIDLKDVLDDDEVFLIMSPSNTVGAPVVADCMEVAKGVGDRPVIIVNGYLSDVPSAAGVMQVQGRSDRINFLNSFWEVYLIKLLFPPGSPYPLLGIIRREYPGGWEVWQKDKTDVGEPEVYNLLKTFDHEPSSDEVSNAFRNRPRGNEKEAEIPVAFSLGLLATGAIIAATAMYRTLGTSLP